MLARSDDAFVIPIILFSAIALALLWAGAVRLRSGCTRSRSGGG